MQRAAEVRGARRGAENVASATDQRQVESGNRMTRQQGMHGTSFGQGQIRENVAARNQLLKFQGHHSAREFQERLNQAIAEARPARGFDVDVIE